MNTSASRRVTARVVEGVVMISGLTCIVLLGGIFLSLFVQAAVGFGAPPLVDTLTAAERASLSPSDLDALVHDHDAGPTLAGFLFGATWRPGALGQPSYGLLPLLVSTLLTTVIAMGLAAPLGLMTASWLALRASPRVRRFVKLSVELLSALPSVVIGFLGILITGPFLGWLTGDPGGLMALNGGVLLAIMALPTIVSLSDDAIRGVPRTVIEGSLALGADRWQTLIHAVWPAARSGLFAAFMLGMGRAVGETMTVLMATGNASAMPTSLTDPVRTMTATLAIELGEVPRGTAHFHTLFAVGLALFLLTLAINAAAEWISVRQRRMEGGV